MDSQLQYHPKTYFYHHDQIQLNEENSNDSTLQDMMSRMEQLLKGMQNTSEKMDDMARRVEKLRMENLNQTTIKTDIMGGEENEFDHNQGIFSSQPMINPKNIFQEDNHASFSLEENYAISYLNEKSSFYSCGINFEEQMEHNVKGNDDLILEDIDMLCEDQMSYINNDFALNQEVKDYKKYIFIENVQGEFWEEDFSMDEEEEFIVDEEIQEDMEFFKEKFDEIISDIHVLFSDFESDALIEIDENNENHMNHGEEFRKIEDQSFKTENIYVKERDDIQEVKEIEFWEDKRGLLEPMLNFRTLRKIFFTDWHDHFIDFKYNLLRSMSTNILSPCTPTLLSHEVICMTKLQNHLLKMKIMHQRFAAILPQILYEHIYPIPKVRKIFYIAWHFLPARLGVFYLRLVLYYPKISFKYIIFLMQVYQILYLNFQSW